LNIQNPRSKIIKKEITELIQYHFLRAEMMSDNTNPKTDPIVLPNSIEIQSSVSVEGVASLLVETLSTLPESRINSERVRLVK